MSVETVPIERRRNRVANPSFETNATGWTGIGASTVARSTVRAQSGTASGLITFGAGAPVSQGASVTVTGLTVGAVYALSAYLWVPAASLAAAPALYISGLGPVGPAVSAADQWVRVGDTFTATATSHTITVSNNGTTTAGLTAFVDAVMLEQAAAVGAYFDGATPATGTEAGDYTHSWTGTAHASASVESELVVRYIITATVEPDTTPPRVRIDLTDRKASATTGVTVTRIGADGRAVPVRTSDGGQLPLSVLGAERVGLLYDYEAPYGAAIQYSIAESPAVRSDQVTVDELRVWLIHPGIPSLSRPIKAVGMSGRRRPVRRGVHRPMGSRYPVVQSDGQRQAAEYTLTIRTSTLEERRAVNDLIEDAGVLLLDVPATKGWGVGAEYVSIDDTDEDRLLQYGPEPRRNWSLPILVVDRPAGGSTSSRTLADLMEYATLADINAAYPTLYDILVGP